MLFIVLMMLQNAYTAIGYIILVCLFLASKARKQ